MLTDDFPVESASAADRDILPISFCEERPASEQAQIVSFAGTGFRLAADPELLITCWHCVANDKPGYGYAVALPEPGEPRRPYRMHPLLTVERDAYGSDLATARIFDAPAERKVELRLATRALTGGADVWSWGYPLTSEHRSPSGEVSFTLHGRWLEGYVTRSFWYEHPGGERIAAYELDMPAPEGLSGAPLVKRPGTEVVGVIFGSHDVARIGEYSTVDPTTGERRPEVQRIFSFALAHYTSALTSLTGPATRGASLADYTALATATQEATGNDTA